MRNKPNILLVLLIVFFSLTGCKTKNETSKERTVQAPGEVSNSKLALNNSLCEAVLNGQFPEVINLLEKGVDVNYKDQDGRTALMYASFNGNTVIMQKLIEKGALINITDKYGRTALMLASSGPFPVSVKLLLDNNADPDVVDTEEHFTALMYAAAEGQLETVKMLLKYKADPSLKDVDGDNAITFAHNNGHKDIVTLIKSLQK